MFRSIPSKLTQKIRFLSLAILSGGLLLAGCAALTSASTTNNSKSRGASAPPSIATPPASVDVTVGQTATFSVIAAGTAPLSYQWQRNGANIAGATLTSYTTPSTTSADNGSTFKVL